MLEVSNLSRYSFMGGRDVVVRLLQADTDGSFSGDAMPVGGLVHGRGRHQHSSGCS